MSLALKNPTLVTVDSRSVLVGRILSGKERGEGREGNYLRRTLWTGRRCRFGLAVHLR
jgi:hypothetical protein